MALSGFGELAATLALVATIWLAGAVYIKAADYFMQIRNAPEGGRSRAALRASRPRRSG